MEEPPTPPSKATFEWTEEELDLAWLFLQLATPQESPGSTMAPPAPPAFKKIPFPKFSSRRPDIFFKLLESIFETHGVTTESDKFTCLTMAIDISEMDEKSCEVIVNKPDDAYTALKKAILANLAPSDLHQVRALLNKEKLGETKPSDFLARLTRIGTIEGLSPAATQVDIRDCWLRGLPTEWHTTLLGYADLKTAAETADTLKLWRDNPAVHSALYHAATGVGAQNTFPVSAMDAGYSPQVAASAPSETDRRLARLEEMMLKMSNLMLQQNQGGGNGTNNNKGNNNNTSNNGGYNRRRSRSRSPSRLNNGLCYYHHKFGLQAYKCSEGCLHYNTFCAQQGSLPDQANPGNFPGRAQ